MITLAIPVPTTGWQAETNKFASQVVELPATHGKTYSIDLVLADPRILASHFHHRSPVRFADGKAVAVRHIQRLTAAGELDAELDPATCTVVWQ